MRAALPGLLVSASSDVLPEYREHARFFTTALNAYVAPRMRRYLGNLRDRLSAADHTGDIAIMTSSGGIVPAVRIEDLPALSMLSGPAAGVIGAAHIGQQAGRDNLITYDMGGTSTDVCMIHGGAWRMTNAGRVGAFPLALQQIDINSVGAGGGSIAAIGPGGVLSVGPRSAGAYPGPACYGRGGTQPTVTDANVGLGRLGTDQHWAARSAWMPERHARPSAPWAPSSVWIRAQWPRASCASRSPAWHRRSRRFP